MPMLTHVFTHRAGIEDASDRGVHSCGLGDWETPACLPTLHTPHWV
jgi:hypothetical protein